jgi:hypothetical protein
MAELSRFEVHRGLAEYYLKKAEAKQKVIDRVEQASIARRGPVAETELRKHQPYIDLVNDRNKFEKLAQLYATMALLYK